MSYTVQKVNYGSSRWHVVTVNGGALFLKCSSKRVATAMAAFASGPNATTYAAMFTSLRGDASTAIHAAHRAGVGPTLCNADADTGAPL